MSLVYPKAEWTPSGVDGGSMLGGTPRCVWHTTETAPSSFFTAKTYYHLQIREWGGRVLMRQFIDFERASRALRREDAVHTNRRGRFCPNIALVSYARLSAGLSDAMVNEIGEMVDWMASRMGIPPTFPLTFRGGEAYGYDGVGRMTAHEWTDFTGHCGHQHVYRNTHWDPGRFPTDRILASIGEPEGATDLMAFLPLKRSEDRRSDNALVAELLNAAYGTGLPTNGTWSDNMTRVIKTELAAGSADLDGTMVTGQMFGALLVAVARRQGTSSGTIPKHEHTIKTLIVE